MPRYNWTNMRIQLVQRPGSNLTETNRESMYSLCLFNLGVDVSGRCILPETSWIILSALPSCCGSKLNSPPIKYYLFALPCFRLETEIVLVQHSAFSKGFR